MKREGQGFGERRSFGFAQDRRRSPNPISPFVMAIKSILSSQTRFATMALEAGFLRPVIRGIVTAEARVVSHEGRTLEGQAIIYDEERRPVLEFTWVCFISVRERGERAAKPPAPPHPYNSFETHPIHFDLQDRQG
ncbi:MAG: PaaI family thioesterase [Anaerolineae bacterium]|nr:PaaI family thioesterase [Anaerolineae bacterium]